MIKKTRTYGIFKSLKGNRRVDPVHVAKLVESLKVNDLTSVKPIVVNEKMQVIDGQHTLKALKTLEREVSYVQATGLDLMDIRQLNVNVRAWSLPDYIDSYCALGNENYIQLREFIKKHVFSPTIAAILLGGYAVNKDSPRPVIKSGNFKVVSKDRAEEFVKILTDLKPYFTAVNVFLDRNFHLALIRILYAFEMPIEEFMKILNTSNRKITPQLNMRDYLRALEDIYNHGRKSKRVRFF